MPQSFKKYFWLEESLHPPNSLLLRNCLEAIGVVVSNLMKREESSEFSNRSNPNKRQKTGRPRENAKGRNEGSNPLVNDQTSNTGKLCHRCSKHAGVKISHNTEQTAKSMIPTVTTYPSFAQAAMVRERATWAPTPTSILTLR